MTDTYKATPPPVAGEVEELVANLRTMATDAGLACQPGDFKMLTLAADMLQRLGKQEADCKQHAKKHNMEAQ